MNCPRCKTPIGPLANPDSIVTCPGCGSRLMTRSAALRSQGGKPAAAAPGPAAPPASPPAAPALSSNVASSSAADLPPSATLPPTPAQLLTLPSLARPDAVSGAGTGSGRRAGARPAEKAERGRPSEASEPSTGPAADSVTLAQVLREVQALRATQERILALLERQPVARPLPDGESGGMAIDDSTPMSLSPIRLGRRRSVLLLDDDALTREAAVEELHKAEVPVRAYDDGHAALAGMAQERPDVIVIELGIGGDLAARDVINMIKATMEWVDIPVVLWTREAVANQREARQIHGADEIVPKAGGAQALVACVISLFRRS
jgi:CheY-like chemotaxis protein